MELMEISAHFQEWRNYIRSAKVQPTNPLWQNLAVMAQAKLVMAQAQYFAEVRP
jgi:hypothetical protein